MADSAPNLDSNLDTGTPRWVKLFGIITVVVLLLFVVMLLGGGHGPGRHKPSHDVTEHGVERR
jgi:ABC-type transporter Mla subunit MlaD